MPKVFGIGMFKTGTTSLGRCFEILGYKTLHGPWWPENQMILDPWYRNPKAWPQYHNNLKALTQDFEAFQDYPWMFLYEELDSWYPDAKFILTARDSEAVAESDLRMWKRMGMKSIPPKQQFIDRYQDHYHQVIKYFKNKDNLLIVNLAAGDDWDKICNFLDKPIPNRPFPHLNKAPLPAKIKICYPEISNPGRSYQLLLEGLQHHPNVFLTSPENCDYLLLEFRHYPSYFHLAKDYPKKTIIVDYRDAPHDYLIEGSYRLYFKRSVVDRDTQTLITRASHISYAIMDKFIYPHNPIRDIDVGCYFNQGHQQNRNSLLQFTQSLALPDKKIKTGLVTPDGEVGRTAYNKIYYYHLKRTKILLTANPDNWEGDSRLWEGLANGCLVMVDRMQTPIINPLIHERHLIYYDNLNDLEAKINYYLQHDNECQKISNQGHRFAMEHHRSINRIGEILLACKDPSL